ncbi:hypothetical protein ACH40E_27310 [Streptomyces acidicola]|uniref:hypothetical protein n=1 Tax=Streptomyces acidicola TaxID=2596892 RepID=UPI0037B1222E
MPARPAGQQRGRAERSMPSVRHSPRRLKEVVAALTTASTAISAALEDGFRYAADEG